MALATMMLPLPQLGMTTIASVTQNSQITDNKSKQKMRWV
jgi:hypothetical protein